MARQALQLLDRPQSMDCRDVVGRGAEEIERSGVALQPRKPIVPVAPRHAHSKRSLYDTSVAWDEWGDVAAMVRECRRITIRADSASDLREVALFLQGQFTVVVASTACPDAVPAGSVLVVLQPEEIPARELSALGHRMRNCGDAGQAVVVLTTHHRVTLSDAPKALASVAYGLTGTVVELPRPLASPARRHAVFDELLSQAWGCTPSVDADARLLIGDYTWPGGLEEMRSVVSELRHVVVHTVDAASLERLGWRCRTRGATSVGGHSPLACEALRALERGGPMRCGELAQRLGRPTRTVVRALRELTDCSVVVRDGRGRATRYRTIVTTARADAVSDAEGVARS
ncbi:MAG: hypothetical protein K8T90_20505 [Planctomycetes bacterium]|nr:hypothetical protein [Planctomycetota bacterium]